MSRGSGWDRDQPVAGPGVRTGDADGIVHANGSRPGLRWVCPWAVLLVPFTEHAERTTGFGPAAAGGPLPSTAPVSREPESGAAPPGPMLSGQGRGRVACGECRERGAHRPRHGSPTCASDRSVEVGRGHACPRLPDQPGVLPEGRCPVRRPVGELVDRRVGARGRAGGPGTVPRREPRSAMPTRPRVGGCRGGCFT